MSLYFLEFFYWKVWVILFHSVACRQIQDHKEEGIITKRETKNKNHLNSGVQNQTSDFTFSLWSIMPRWQPLQQQALQLCYTSDSPWKFWLVESIQSIYNSLWTRHMINAISAAFIMSSSKSAWLPRPLSVLLRNRKAECFASVSEEEECIIKQLLNLVFAWYHELSKLRVCIICLSFGR